MAFSNTKVIGSSSTRYYYDARQRSRQAKPYVRPLPFEVEVGNEHKGSVIALDQFYHRNNLGQMTPLLSAIRAELTNHTRIVFNSGGTNLHKGVHNKALDKVGEQLEYVENFFEAWYERREAYKLLGSAGKGIIRFLTSWNKPRYWKSLFKDSSTLVKQPKTLPEAWLLANFAVKPLVGTVDSAMRLLCNDFPPMWVEGTSIEKYPSSFDSSPYDVFCENEYIVKHGIEVIGFNPNAQLLNTMGLTTPFSSLLSVVPWSWAVNYFVNISDMVSNFEIRYPGVNTGDSYTTVVHRVNYHGLAYRYINGEFTTQAAAFFEGDYTYVRRKVSSKIPTYKLHFGIPALGSSSFANLFSAIALTMKGKAK